MPPANMHRALKTGRLDELCTANWPQCCRKALFTKSSCVLLSLCLWCRVLKLCYRI